MEHMAGMIDMALDETDKNELGMGHLLAPEQPKYPPGLCVRLTEHELEKIGVDHSDWTVGNIFHLHALAKVTSISSHESEGGEHCCIEMQVTHLSGESEDEENVESEKEEAAENNSGEEESEPPKKKGRANLYF